MANMANLPNILNIPNIANELEFSEKFPGFVLVEESHLLDNFDQKLIHDYLVIHQAQSDTYRFVICYYNTMRYSIKIYINGHNVVNNSSKMYQKEFEQLIKLKQQFHPYILPNGSAPIWLKHKPFGTYNFKWEFIYEMIDYMYLSRPAHLNYVKKKFIEL